MTGEPDAAMPHPVHGCASPRLQHVLALLDEMRDSLARARARCAAMLDDEPQQETAG